MSKEKKGPSVRTLRYLTMGGVVAVYAVGATLNTGLGSLSAFGIGDVSAICPLGVLETAIAGRIVLPLPLVALLVAIVLTVFLGKAFCGWICPVPLVRKLVTNKEERDAHEADRKNEREGKRREWPSFGGGQTTALGVLAVTLATTLIFGFPVFCLVCPIGLVFATVFAVVKLVTFNELVIDLLVFPALIVLELVVLRKWCSSLCPVGALLGLFSRFNRSFLPTVDHERCMADTHDSRCDLCHRACNYDIDLVHGMGSGALSDCSKCGECASVCPSNAISFPLRRPSEAEAGELQEVAKRA